LQVARREKHTLRQIYLQRAAETWVELADSWRMGSCGAFNLFFVTVKRGYFFYGSLYLSGS
jgi:hypothetical protein